MSAMRKFGLIGYPLGHSFSQRYFTEKFQAENIQDCGYQSYPLESIDELAKLLRDPLLRGLNITIPYKQQVMRYLDEQDPVVSRIQACNCIDIRDGRLYGYNTDVVGFRESLLKKLEPRHDRALVLGTGGASKAVEYTLSQLGIPFQTVSRAGARGIAWPAAAGETGAASAAPLISYEEVTGDLLGACRLVINTTPLGTFPRTEECPLLPYEAIGPGHYLFDLVYNPGRTLFLQKGEERGALVENGYDMLVLQAEESWRIWNS